MLRAAGCTAELRAHRALDDAIALKVVVKYMAETLGASTLKLLHRLCVSLN